VSASIAPVGIVCMAPIVAKHTSVWILQGHHTRDAKVMNGRMKEA
jgi:hypothetical protein